MLRARGWGNKAHADTLAEGQRRAEDVVIRRAPLLWGTFIAIKNIEFTPSLPSKRSRDLGKLSRVPTNALASKAPPV